MASNKGSENGLLEIILKKPIPSFCFRQLYGVDLSKPRTFEGVLARVYNTRTIRIGVYLGEPQLFALDKMGVASGYLYSFFQDTVNLVNSGEVDTAPMFYLASRTLITDFTCFFRKAFGLAAFVDTVVGLPSRVGKPSSILDLNRADITVSIIRGTMGEDAALKFLPLAQKEFFKTRDDALNAVGRTADIVFYDENVIALYNTQNDNRLVMVENTRTYFAAGAGYITKKKM